MAESTPAATIQPIFESFSIIILSSASPTDKPTTTYTYTFQSQPSSPKDKKEGTTIQQISHFCFPDELTFGNQVNNNSENPNEQKPKGER